MLGKAIAIAAKAHEGQVDKGGYAYILHPLRVMSNLKSTDKELCAIAVMHDVVEDSEITLTDLEGMDFPTRVVAGVDAMTRRKDESYQDFIERCACNSDGLKVKLADLIDNSDITRLKGITEKDINRMEKYHRAYTFLKERE